MYRIRRGAAWVPGGKKEAGKEAGKEVGQLKDRTVVATVSCVGHMSSTTVATVRWVNLGTSVGLGASRDLVD